MNELQQEQVRKLVLQFRDGSLGRRDFLRQVVGLGIGTAVSYSLLGQAESKAQEFGVPTTMAIGEENPPIVDDQQATTLMVGEEDVHQPPQVTTYAVGEEDQQATTQVVGEEDAHKPPQVTTYKAGEEEGDYGYLPPQVTTQALGEEDQHHDPGHLPTTEMVGEEGLNQLPKVTTRALGEEDPHRQLPTTAMAGEEDNYRQKPTSAMVGEEDTQVLPPQPSTRRLGEEGHIDPPQASTMRVGEEGNAVPVCPPQRQPWRPWNGWNRW